MAPIRFNPETDLAPTPFDEQICHLALEMKGLGLTWQPHVGCFVWDPDHGIKPESPFPGRIYFILSLPRFVEIFGSTREMARKLVWLPTWHQACLICKRLEISDAALQKSRLFEPIVNPTGELLHIYTLIVGALKERTRGS
jgi:hypothetical protein